MGTAIGGTLCTAAYLGDTAGYGVSGGVYSFLVCGAVGAVIGAQTRTEGQKLKHGPVIYRRNLNP